MPMKAEGSDNYDSACMLVTWILQQVLLEPYARAYYFGSERVSKRYGSEPEQDSCAYKDIKALCEQSFSGYYLLLLIQNCCGSECMSRVARYPVFYGSSRISAPISRLPERSYPGDEISRI